MWSEILPDSCPPLDSCEPSNMTLYRVSRGNPVVDSDFFSQRKLDPDKKFNVDECIARSVSVHQNILHARKLLKLPKFKDCCISEITLNKDDGLIDRKSVV